MWYLEGVQEAIESKTEGKWLLNYFRGNKESLEARCQTVIGTQDRETNISIEMSANGLDEIIFYIEDQFGKELDNYVAKSNEVSVQEAFRRSLDKFYKA
ncbi:hypothetical protein MZM54_00190 [[Brevibacterium] frigoritolerans]|nr:hypothetical protein [Peribacillus frigoritolerans]